MPPHKRLTFPVHCPLCGQPVTLHLSGRPTVIGHDGSPAKPGEAGRLARTVWACPYCSRMNEGGFPGRIAFATKRDQGPNRAY